MQYKTYLKKIKKLPIQVLFDAANGISDKLENIMKAEGHEETPEFKQLALELHLIDSVIREKQKSHKNKELNKKKNVKRK